MSQDKQPVTIFWVVAHATDVGKSTVATALLRCLNARGIPALGFKPMAATRFRKHIDRALEYERILPGRLVGRDSLLLARASPLTRDEDADLITPWQQIFFRTNQDVLLVRMGSQCLDNVSYYTTPGALALMKRPDLARLAQLLKLPFASAQPFDASKHMRTDVQARAYAVLLERKPAAVVVEGAGSFAPNWMGAPPATHIVSVGDDDIALYPRVNVQTKGPAANGALYTKQLLEALTRREAPVHRVTFCMHEEKGRDAAMERLMAELLAKAQSGT